MVVAAGAGTDLGGLPCSPPPASVVNGFRWSGRPRSAPAAATSTRPPRSIRSALLSSGLGALVLAVLTGILAFGVLRRQRGGPDRRARADGRLPGLCDWSVPRSPRSAATSSGRPAWRTPPRASPTTSRRPTATRCRAGWSGSAGGLTDLQALGYIAVAILLLHPASQEYFRTRANGVRDAVADRPCHRRDRGHRAGLRPPPRRGRIRPVLVARDGPGWPPRAGGAPRGHRRGSPGRSGHRRGPRAGGRAAVRRRAAGRSARQQRRAQPQHPVPALDAGAGDVTAEPQCACGDAADAGRRCQAWPRAGRGESSTSPRWPGSGWRCRARPIRRPRRGSPTSPSRSRCRSAHWAYG